MRWRRKLGRNSEAPGLIIGNNVLAHVSAIHDFLRAAVCLKPNGTAVFKEAILVKLKTNQG